VNWRPTFLVASFFELCVVHVEMCLDGSRAWTSKAVTCGKKSGHGSDALPNYRPSHIPIQASKLNHSFFRKQHWQWTAG